jgi:prepilin-type processing-associated H-X9-DG protein
MRQVVNISVLVLVVALGVGLALPAIQKTREAADRTQCGNNLRILVLSMHNYASTKSYFPQAALANGKLPPEERLSWQVTIIPYVESDNLYVQMDKESGWRAEENRWAALIALKYLTCPAFPDQRPTSTMVPSHYIGVTGLGRDAATLPLDDLRAGAFGYDRRWGFEDGKRRMNTLIVVADTTQIAPPWTAGGWPTARGLEDNGSPLIGLSGQFGGVHKAGAMVAFADGSAGLWRPTDDSRIIKSMVTLHGSDGAAAMPEN